MEHSEAEEDESGYRKREKKHKERVQNDEDQYRRGLKEELKKN